MLTSMDHRPPVIAPELHHPVEDDTVPLMQDIELESNEQMAEPVSRSHRLGRSVKGSLRAFRGKFTKKPETPVNKPSPINPDLYTGDQTLTGLNKLVAERADIATLKRSNFSIDHMFESGMGIDSFYDAGYDLRELHQLIPEFEQLLVAGFTKAFLGDRWQYNILHTLYGNYELSKGEMCYRLGFTIEDFMLARTIKEEYAELGIDGQALVRMGIDFEHLFAMHMPLEQFVEEFAITKEHVLAFNLTPHQARALSFTRGWNLIALEECLGMTDDEVKAFGVALS